MPKPTQAHLIEHATGAYSLLLEPARLEDALASLNLDHPWLEVIVHLQGHLNPLRLLATQRLEAHQRAAMRSAATQEVFRATADPS